MPFTFAHPVAVIPLYRRLRAPGCLSALVIGSMAPDFVYWFPFPIYREMSHTIQALFTFCLPAGFSVFCLYHLLLKPPIMALLPRAIFVRLPSPPIPWRPRYVALVLLAILLGAFTHIAWDAFTHHDTPVTRLLPFLETHLLTRSGYVVRVFKVLQHTSTLVGCGALALLGWRWYNRTPPRDDIDGEGLTAREKVALTACIIVPSIIGAIGYGLSQAPWKASVVSLQQFLVSGAVGGIGTLGFVLTALGLLWPCIARRLSKRISTHAS